MRRKHLVRRVKGILFADYVRMIRGHKGIDLSCLPPEDQALIHSRIQADAWYPMETFERLGDLILAEVAGGSLEAVRLWGRFSVDHLRFAQPLLLAPGDPVETLRRFQVLRAGFFDFEALEIITLVDGTAEVAIAYHMGRVAEEAASYQTMGFFERLVELAGAKDIQARFAARSWTGDPSTVLLLKWR